MHRRLSQRHVAKDPPSARPYRRTPVSSRVPPPVDIAKHGAGPYHPDRISVSTMRVSGTFLYLHELGGGEQRPEPDRVPRELIGPALLAVDHADRRAHPQTG